MSGSDWRAGIAGVVVSALVHGGIGLWLSSNEGTRIAIAASGSTKGQLQDGLCAPTRRCPLLERRPKRGALDQNPVDLEVLQAELLPALGNLEQDPKKLPVLQTYEEDETVEDGVNLKKQNDKPKEKLQKDFKPRPKRRVTKNKLNDLLRGHRNRDKRRRATALDKIVGNKHGEVGGTGSLVKAGNKYAAAVRRQLRKDFFVPEHIPEEVLDSLRLTLLIESMSLDGAVLEYRVLRPSGHAGFDETALNAIRRYVPKEGGTKTLPRPDPETLRYINAKGFKIHLDGKHRSR